MKRLLQNIFSMYRFSKEKKSMLNSPKDLLLKLRWGFCIPCTCFCVEKRCMFARGYLHLDCKYGERARHSAARFTPFESFLPRLSRRDTYRSRSVYFAARINNTAYFHPYPSDFTGNTRRRIV